MEEVVHVVVTMRRGRKRGAFVITPVVAVDKVARLENAKMMCSRDGEYLYSEKEACAKAGVNQSAFRRWKAGKPIGGKKTGRNRKLSLAACEEINKEQTEKSMNLDSAKASDMSNIFSEKIRKELGYNAHSPPGALKLCRNTIKKYKQDAGLVVRSGSKKNTTRSNAFLNIRNPLSWCSVLTFLQDFGIDWRLYFQFDDVSMMLNGWDKKPKLITTKRSA